MLRQLPGKTEVPNLLVDISQTGLGAGLEEKLFQPTGEVQKDFYAELPIKLRYTGSYHELGKFVSGIAALPRIVTLHDIDIKPADERFDDQPHARRDGEDLSLSRRDGNGDEVMLGRNSCFDAHARVDRRCACVERLRQRQLGSAHLYRRGQGATRWTHRCVAARCIRRRTFAYEAGDRRSPFVADAPQRRVSTDPNAVTGPDPNRPREFLEQFPLDTMHMVGTLADKRASFGLVQTADGLVHRVTVGNHLGQNYGRVISITDSEIRLVEIISDGLGGYLGKTREDRSGRRQVSAGEFRE